MSDVSRLGLNGVIYNIKDPIARASAGGPNVAQMKNAMTDTNKVYVYTGSEADMINGNWYYYDGTKWSSGGVYHATAVETDKTLSLPNIPADAKAVGEKLLNNTDKLEVLNRYAERLDTVSETKTVHLVDNNNRFVIDENGNRVIGDVWLPVTDISGLREGYPADSGMVGKTFLMGLDELGIPIMYLNHPDIETLKTKGDGDIGDVNIVFPFAKIKAKLKKFKVQGASSQAYPKKNYTITFYDNVILQQNWGPHKKYVIKADWVDFSHMRNEIGAKLWGKIRGTRVNQYRARFIDNSGSYLTDSSGNILCGENEKCFSMGMNYGAIDGYPICVIINGVFWGIYSLTVPKDDWMAGMIGDNNNEAIVAAEDHTKATQFRDTVLSPNEDGEMYDKDGSKVAFSMEYVTDEGDMGWLSTSINGIIDAVNGTYSSSQACIDAISEHLDIDSAIDYFLFSCLINNTDGLDKNFLLDTWDGVKWYFVAYDMDGTFGNNWDGKSYIPADGGATFSYYANRSRLMDVLVANAKALIKERWQELRSSVLSVSSFADLVWNYAVNIPESAFNYEVLRWPGIIGSRTNNHEQILYYYMLRSSILDTEINNL